MTDITNATEVETKPIEWPALYVGIVPDMGIDGKPTFWPIGSAYRTPEELNAAAESGIPFKTFRLPSTADAERAKERERLIGEVVNNVRAWDTAASTCWVPVIDAARALAAFDADNGGSKKSNPTDAAELERLREAKYQTELDMRTTAMSRDVPTAVSPRVWNAWITACDRLSAFEKKIGGGT